MDTLSPEKRSEVMSHIRSKDTKPEMVAHRHHHAPGVSLPFAFVHTARTSISRHRVSQVAYGQIRERMLLGGNDVEVQCGVLAGRQN